MWKGTGCCISSSLLSLMTDKGRERWSFVEHKPIRYNCTCARRNAAQIGSAAVTLATDVSNAGGKGLKLHDVITGAMFLNGLRKNKNCFS